MQGLFTDADLDQDMIEIERRQEERRRAEEKEQSKIEEKKEEAAATFDKKMYILDGYSIIYRSYFAHIKAPLTDGKGLNVSAYFGFFSTLFFLLSHYEMDYLAITMDERQPTFRHIMYPEYKANRDKAPEDLHAQVPWIIESLRKMNLPVLSKAGYEADDVIASLVRKAKNEGIESIMVTGDKDLCQLIEDHVYALRPPKKGDDKYKIFKEENVKEEYGIYPNQIVDYLSIIGDTADNVPGIKGLGEKGAAKLLEQYLTLDGIYRHLDGVAPGVRKKLEAGRESAELSKKLIALSFEALPDDFDFTSLSLASADLSGAVPDFEHYNCRSLIRRAGGYNKDKAASDLNESDKEEVPSLLSIEETKALTGPGIYECITEYDDLKRRFKEISEFKGGIISFDFLTDGYDNNSPIVGFSFSYEPRRGYYVPLGQNGINEDECRALFDEYIKTGRIGIIGHNVKYDLKCMWRFGSDIGRIVFDTMIGAWLIDSNSNMYGLDDLSLKYLNHTMIDISDLLDKDESISSMNQSLATRWSAGNADIAFRMYRVIERRLYEKNLHDVFTGYELPLIRPLASMEAEGIHLSSESMGKLEGEISSRITKIVGSIYELAGHEFNVNSTQQLSKVLFDELGLQAAKKTQKGYSTDTATLEGLRGKNPIIELLLEYRQLSKLKSTYIDTLPLLCDENARIHTTFLQTGTATGRLSSRNPNLQNIPVRTDEGRLIRSAFTAEEGTVFLSADYSQIELVVLAHMTGDPALQKAFILGEDVHKYTASLIFSKNVDQITSAERRIAKTINFGIMYGMSAFRLAGDLGVSRSEAQDFIKRYFGRYSSVRDFIEKTNKSASELGYVTTRGGHVREVIGINSSNKVEKAAAERVAVNTVIQGTAAEIMKKAMVAIYNEIERRSLKTKMILQVHDELIFQVPLEELDEASSMVKNIMENIDELAVPLRASIENGRCWGDMH